MQNIKNARKKKLRWIIVAYRFICIALVGILIFSLKVQADNKKPVIVKKEILNPNIVMLGDSITDFYDLDKYYGNDKLIVNSGINGNKTEDIIDNIKNRVYAYNPSKIFLLIGVNDILYDNSSANKIVDQIDSIVLAINDKLPNTKIYIESIYPVNDKWNDGRNDGALNASEANVRIKETNKLLKEYCKNNNLKYINVYPSLLDDNNSLNLDYTNDGLHPNDNGYEVITKILKKYM